MKPMDAPPDNLLLAKAEVQERPFTSPTPVAGRLIAWFRAAWNSVSTKWYVRPLLQQQNEFNRLVVQQMEEQDARLVEQDRDQVALTRTIAELTAEVIQLRRQLELWEERASESEQAAP